jgi:hypothetical protein
MTLDTPLIISPEFRANGRIEIYGQHSACDGSVTVARAMPAVLEGRLSTTQWNKFCDDLDEALKPAARMRKIFLAGMILLPIIFIALAAFSFITFTISSKKQFDNFPNDDGFPPPQNNFLGSFIFFIIGGVVLFAGFGILSCVGIRSRNSISTGLRRVCDETSARHPGVSFHVRYESRLWRTSGYGGGVGHHGFHGHHDDHFGHHQHVHVSTTEYIEVYVAGATNNFLPAATSVLVPSAPPASYDPELALGGGGAEKKKSAGERMRELDRMKGLLTEEEYQRKRAEIMSDV